MGVNFEVSSPGKVILHGEHSVVYGKPALAGVIGLRNKLFFKENENQEFSIKFDALGNVTFSLETINIFLQKNSLLFENMKLPEEINHDKFYASVKEFILKNNSNFDEKIISSLSSVFYLLFGILIDQEIKEIKNGISIQVSSEISIGAGLGSSASFGVLLAAAFKIYSQLKNGSQNIELNDENKQYISNWAFCSEKIMHGSPSGLDNTICTFGNIVKFYKGKKPTNVKLQTPLNILLVNTGVSRSTIKIVEKVAVLRMEHPKIIENILNAMGEVVEDAVEVIENLKGEDDFKNFQKLERLVSINNNLLRSIGVSHSSLEKIFSIAEKYGFSVKLTGAGCGGYSTILLPPKFEELQEYKNLCENLTKHNFEWKCTTIGGKGLIFNLFSGRTYRWHRFQFHLVTVKKNQHDLLL